MNKLTLRDLNVRGKRVLVLTTLRWWAPPRGSLTPGAAIAPTTRKYRVFLCGRGPGVALLFAQSGSGTRQHERCSCHGTQPPNRLSLSGVVRFSGPDDRGEDPHSSW